jgi:hypothetical protein
VAVATQDQLKAASTFEEALGLLVPGATLRPTTRSDQAGQVQPPQPKTTQPSPGPPAIQTTSPDIERLTKQAQQLISDYERLSAEGKHREAGEKLDQLKQVLAELKRKSGS